MASWMVHLRIADRLLDRIPNLAPLELVFGNIAPDSGVPTGDFASFDPPKSVSHFHVIEKGHRVAGYGAYAEKYLTPDRARLYSGEECAFYLGYFSHLLTDYLRALEVVRPLIERDAENYANDKAATVRKWKEDWYDLDFRYLRDHPDFRAFSLFSYAAGFENKYLDFFPQDAFSDSQKRIMDFYAEKRPNLDRYYPWLTPDDADNFVASATDRIEAEISGLRGKE